jgi:putative transposase
MWIERFHETWNGSQPSAERWLTPYAYYYNHLRSHQTPDNEPPVEAAGLS